MILVDANLLIYAHVTTFRQHEPARDWLDEQLNGSTPVGLPWPILLAFLRLVTNPPVFAEPEPTMDAWSQVVAWIGCDPVWIPQPGERHADILGEFLTQHGVSANLVPDAHLAALAVEYGLTLYSTDGGFARFPRLRWEDPLKA